MDSPRAAVITMPRSAAIPSRNRQTAWFYYRNARRWGKPLLWSIHYAREASVKFG